MDTPKLTQNAKKPLMLSSSLRAQSKRIHGLDEQFASCAEQLQSLSRLSERMKESMNRQAELLERICNDLGLKEERPY